MYLIIPIHGRKSLFNTDQANENTGVWQPQLQDSWQGFSGQTWITQLQLFQYFHEREMSFHRLQGTARLPRNKPLSQKVRECAGIHRPTSYILGRLTFSTHFWHAPREHRRWSALQFLPRNRPRVWHASHWRFSPDGLIMWVIQPNPINCLWNCNFMFRIA